MIIGICGASGYIGWGLFNFLLNRGEQVMGTYFKHPKLGLAKFNMLKNSFSIFKRCDYVVVASAYAKIQFCEENPTRTYKLNVQATEGLLQYLDNRHIKTLFISSDMALDHSKLYGCYKAEVERFIQTNLNYCCFIRPGKINNNNMGELCKEIYRKIQEH